MLITMFESDVNLYGSKCGLSHAVNYQLQMATREIYGIVEGKNLIVTYDEENGGLDSEYIDRLIKDTFDL